MQWVADAADVFNRLPFGLAIIEQLKEKRLQEYKAELLHEEQKMLDEIGSQLYTRGHRKEDAV